jgi:hypothetical protein
MRQIAQCRLRSLSKLRQNGVLTNFGVKRELSQNPTFREPEFDELRLASILADYSSK